MRETAFPIFAIFDQTKLACERGQILSIICDGVKGEVVFRKSGESGCSQNNVNFGPTISFFPKS